MYSMKAVAELTRVRPDTLRAWEKRHHAISPGRANNGRRIYSSSDVARLRLLKRVCSLGHAISKVAGLSDNELEKLVDEADCLSNMQRSVEFSDALLKAVQHYDMNAIDEILGLAATGMAPVDFATRILGPTLVEIGIRWHGKKINVAQEHLLSQSIKRLIYSLIQVYKRQSVGPKLLFGTLSPERHELGLLMSCLIATGRSCQCYYLGSDIPKKDLLEAVASVKPSVLVLGIVQENLSVSELREIGVKLPETTGLWIGGPGTASLDDEQLSGWCRRISSLDQFVTEIGFLETVTRRNI